MKNGKMTIGFAHYSYRFSEKFKEIAPDTDFFEFHTAEELEKNLDKADILVLSGFWKDDFVDRAPHLKLIQSISAGTDQYDKDLLRKKGIPLASAQGVNEHAVSQHAIGMMLGIARRLHVARDAQARNLWPKTKNPANRERELFGKSLVVVGYGVIGSRIGSIANALGMNVTAVTSKARPLADGGTSVAFTEIDSVLPSADVVILSCPLTSDTQGLIDYRRIMSMKKDAILINVARGPVIREKDLISALDEGHLLGVGLDCFEIEPLQGDSPLWGVERVVITPHRAGETEHYESNVLKILTQNIQKMERGETDFVNKIV